MVANGLTIKPQIPALPVQLGTMIGFAQAGSASSLAHAWGGVESRVWGNMRELDRRDVAFPEVGSHPDAYMDFRDTVIRMSQHYMNRRVDMACLQFEKFGNFRQIGVEEPLGFAELLVEARGYGIVSKITADVMLISAAKVFEERGIDIASSELVSGALSAIREEEFEATTDSSDIAIRPKVQRFMVNGGRTDKWRKQRMVGALVGTAGGASLAVGTYMLWMSAPGIVFVALGLAGVIFGLSQFFRGMAD